MRIQPFRAYSKGTIISPQRTTVTIPAFAVTPDAWAGASDILAEFPFLNTDYYFSLRLPVNAFGEDFVAAVRWVVDDIVSRFIFWEHDTDINLDYPIYNGEKIGLNAVFEIWSVGDDAATLTVAEVLENSILNFPDVTGLTPNTQPSANITLVQRTPVSLPPSANCNPFCNNLCG